jgi:predicted small metal-binding protein
MRSLTCSCGRLIEADDDRDLFRRMREHADEAHREESWTDDQIRALITAKAKAA